MAQHRAEVAGFEHVRVRSECGLGPVLGRHDHRTCARIARRERERERATHGSQAPVECEFSEQADVLEALAVDDTGRRENADRDGQVEPRVVLAQVRGREIDRDPPIRKSLSHARDRRAHARGTLAHSGLRQPDDIDPW